MKKDYFNIMFYILIFITLTMSSCTFKVGEGLISFDQTILLQFAIILAALYLLNLLIFKPMLSLLDRREQLTKGTVEEARKLSEKAENLIEDYKKKMNEARTEASEKRAEIRKEAQQIAEKKISEARLESQSVLDNYKKDLDFQVADIKEKIKPEIEDLANSIANKVLGTEV